jgi:hypothetical protein
MSRADGSRPTAKPRLSDVASESSDEVWGVDSDPLNKGRALASGHSSAMMQR